MAYNFTLGGLGFHKLINDEHPYERATAPFRKDQLDTAPIVGDQSLSGWWTRGQMSFHRGAGVRYYELLDGEEVLNRYDTATDINPWEPGELTLGEDFSTVSVPSTIRVACPSGTSAGILAVLNDGTARNITTTTSAALTVPGSPTLYGCTTTPGTDSNSKQFVCSFTEIFVKQGGDTAFTSLWTGANAYRLYWAKSRLWVQGLSGEWFTLSTTGGVVAAGDKFVTFPASESAVTLAESPSVVYLAGVNKVWSVALDDTGAVPVVNSPTVAAILPDGESIGHIYWYLGRLLILSDQGVRVAEQRSDGSLTYGAHLIEGDFSDCQSVQGRGDFAYIVEGGGTGTATLYAINMADNADDLLPAYTPVRTMSDSAGGGFSGAIFNADGRLHAWSSTGTTIRRGTTLPTTGSVTTGYHRLGTLDLKSFRHLKVKVTGSGTVSVSVILPNGTTTSVGTVPASGELDLSTAVTSPQEAVAFKFTLNRATTTTGPTLLGYQLKALPMPKRQRLIRVPLMMFDTERGPTGRALGAEKSAWTRYRALEALEESNALVSYTDSDTGDSGTAYIESVELMQRNGSKGVSRSNGFGGVVTVTLRKVA